MAVKASRQAIGTKERGYHREHTMYFIYEGKRGKNTDEERCLQQDCLRTKIT